MSGEALRTQRSAILNFLDQVIGRYLKRCDGKAIKGGQKIGARQPGDFGCFRLRDALYFIPFDSRGEAHFAQEAIGILA